MAKYILPTAREFLKLAMQKIIFDRRQKTSVNLQWPSFRTRARMATQVGAYPPLLVQDVAADVVTDFTGGSVNGR